MPKCDKCQSYDIKRIHRRFYQRLLIKRVRICNECGHVHKHFKYTFLNKSDS